MYKYNVALYLISLHTYIVWKNRNYVWLSIEENSLSQIFYKLKFQKDSQSASHYFQFVEKCMNGWHHIMLLKTNTSILHLHNILSLFVPVCAWPPSSIKQLLIPLVGFLNPTQQACDLLTPIKRQTIAVELYDITPQSTTICNIAQHMVLCWWNIL